MNLSPTQCRGQCYDWVSNMSGRRSGVATEILSEEKWTLYTHGCGHGLNLAVRNAMKQCRVVVML